MSIKKSTFNRILEFIFIFAFVCPFSITYNFPFMSRLMYLVRMVALVYVILLLISTTKFNMSINDILVIMFYMVLFIPTIIHGGSIIEAISDGGKFISIYLLISIRVKNKDTLVFDWFRNLLFLFVVVNFITMIIWPEGMYTTYNTGWSTSECWFLGDKNGIINYVIPAILLEAISIRMKEEKYINSARMWILTIVGAFTFLWADSSTSLVVFFVWLLIFLLPRVFKMAKLFNIRTYLIVIVIIVVLVTVLNMTDVFSFVIVGILGKDLTLTNRTIIWQRALECIKENPIFGLGYQTTEEIRKNIIQVNTHNHYLWILYRTGFVGLSLFIAVLARIVKSSSKSRHNKITQLLWWTFFCFALEWNFEVSTNYVMPFLFAMLMYVNNYNGYESAELKNLAQ